MTNVKHKAKDKDKKHMMRKNRTNQVMKQQHHDLRIVVNKSNKSVSAQAIQPSGHVVATIDDLNQDGDNKTQRAFNAGAAFAKKLDNKMKIIFDRNGYRYHGRIKAFADGLREGGISI